MDSSAQLDKKIIAILSDANKNLQSLLVPLKEWCKFEYEFDIIELKDFCYSLHNVLNFYFNSMNERYEKASFKKYYLADYSRNLLATIKLFDNTIILLQKCGLNLILNDDYDNHIQLCKQFLISGGSIIPEEYKLLEILKYDPIIWIKRQHSLGAIKNIIFASSQKPEIIITDALENNIEIVKNAEFCLVYDLPIKDGTVTRSDLELWWKERAITTKLSSRMLESLNDVEKRFFRAYYNWFKSDFDPALFSQVYLHYDPKTIKQLIEVEKGIKRLAFQRMDFLILYKNNRIIIEIDGVQHYSTDDKADSKKYAEQVKYDRKMKFFGYEIFRIGGYELMDDKFDTTVSEFFESLKNKYLL